MNDSKKTNISKSDDTIRLAMLGMVEGNGHPYSWSAIINGYDKQEMEKCPYATIPDYLGKQPEKNIGIEGAKVTHIWTEDISEAKQVAKASLIDNVVERPEDVIGQVDAVVIPTDKGNEHVDRARPFIQAGLPVFIDKPMADNVEDLKTMVKWHERGARIISSSAMRYSKEYIPYHMNTFELGEIRFATMTMIKKWETYGIHAVEAIYPVFGPGFISVRNVGRGGSSIVHLRHECGADVIVTVAADMYGSSGLMQLCGTKGNVFIRKQDTFYSFRKQMESFVDYLKTGERPFPFSETVELMKIIIAGIMSKEQNGKEILLADIEV